MSDENALKYEQAAQQLLNASAMVAPSLEVHNGFVETINGQYAAGGTHAQIGAWIAQAIYRGMTEGVWPDAIKR